MLLHLARKIYEHLLLPFALALPALRPIRLGSNFIITTKDLSYEIISSYLSKHWGTWMKGETWSMAFSCSCLSERALRSSATSCSNCSTCNCMWNLLLTKVFQESIGTQLHKKLSIWTDICCILRTSIKTQSRTCGLLNISLTLFLASKLSQATNVQTVLTLNPIHINFTATVNS